jgi:Tfp pilus assembly major pilin PilA
MKLTNKQKNALKKEAKRTAINMIAIIVIGSLAIIGIKQYMGKVIENRYKTIQQ